jgi:hypothetical protein
MGRRKLHTVCLKASHFMSLKSLKSSLRVSKPDTPEMEWDENTFKELWRLANDVPAAGIHVQTVIKGYRYTSFLEWYRIVYSE